MVRFFTQREVPDEQLRYAVIAARYQGQWVFVRRKDRATWEIPGGKREQGEAILDTARRELWEETGAKEYQLHPICVYCVEKAEGPSYGLLCLAEVTLLARLPESEIQERRLGTLLPEKLTYPDIQPALYERVQAWCNVQDSPDELWDIYDKEGNFTGKMHRRGDPLAPGEYHITVHVWLQDEDGSFLLTRRAPTKGYALLWECTGGSALAGEDSRTAAAREVLEETGLTVRRENGKRLFHRVRTDDLNDVWLFRQRFDRNQVRLLPGETVEAKWVAPREILRMDQAGEMCPFGYLREFLSAYID